MLILIIFYSEGMLNRKIQKYALNSLREAFEKNEEILPGPSMLTDDMYLLALNGLAPISKSNIFHPL